MSECNSGVCTEHNRFMEEIYSMKADQKYTKEAVDRIEETLTKFIDKNPNQIRAIATEVATSLIATCKHENTVSDLAERKFSWNRITWIVAGICSIAANAMFLYFKFGV